MPYQVTLVSDIVVHHETVTHLSTGVDLKENVVTIKNGSNGSLSVPLGELDALRQLLTETVRIYNRATRAVNAARNEFEAPDPVTPEPGNPNP